LTINDSFAVESHDKRTFISLVLQAQCTDTQCALLVQVFTEAVKRKSCAR